MPHHNDSSHLARLLESIDFNNENLIEYEVIIVDDHSNSDHLNRAKRLNNLFPNVILRSNLSEKKSGGSSRNIGIECSQGSYILFADNLSKNYMK